MSIAKQKFCVVKWNHNYPTPISFCLDGRGCTKSEQSCQDSRITCTCASHLVKSNSLIIFNLIPDKKGQEKEPQLQMF